MNDERHQWPKKSRFAYGDRVTKKSGASWNGRVIGWYSSSLTELGWVVESEREPGWVRIYPDAALDEALDAATD